MKKLLILLLSSLPILVIGQPNPVPNSRVHDYVGLLSAGQVAALNDDVKAIETKHPGIQMAIVIIDTLSADIPIEDYALQIGLQWHVGNNDSGIVYVLSVRDHKQTIQVARHMEGILTDIETKRIQVSIGGFYKHGQWFTGLQSLVLQFGQIINNIPVAGNTPVTKNNYSAWQITGQFFLLIIFIIAVIWWIILWRHKHKKLKDTDSGSPMDDFNTRMKANSNFTKAENEQYLVHTMFRPASTLPPPSPRAKAKVTEEPKKETDTSFGLGFAAGSSLSSD